MEADEALGSNATISSVLYANMNHPEWKSEFPGKFIPEGTGHLTARETIPFMESEVSVCACHTLNHISCAVAQAGSHVPLQHPHGNFAGQCFLPSTLISLCQYHSTSA
jgi:hypothetical protein